MEDGTEKNQPKWKRLLLLFGTFFKIAALVVGGGYAMLPVIEETFVTKHGILKREEMLDMVAVTQTVPGIIAANSSIYIGMKVAGFAGALAALSGAILPSFLVIVTIAVFFPHLSPDSKYLAGAFAGVRACVTGLIIVTAVRLAKKTVTGWVEAVAASAFFIAALSGVNPAILILCAMPLGCLYAYILKRRIEKASAGGKKGGAS